MYKIYYYSRKYNIICYIKALEKLHINRNDVNNTIQFYKKARVAVIKGTFTRIY